jgi:hypothetical protein
MLGAHTRYISPVGMTIVLASGHIAHVSESGFCSLLTGLCFHSAPWEAVISMQVRRLGLGSGNWQRPIAPVGASGSTPRAAMPQKIGAYAAIPRVPAPDSSYSSIRGARNLSPSGCFQMSCGVFLHPVMILFCLRKKRLEAGVNLSQFPENRKKQNCDHEQQELDNHVLAFRGKELETCGHSTPRGSGSD